MDKSINNPLPVASPQKPFPKWPIIALLSFLLGITSVLAYQKYQLATRLPARQGTLLVAPSPSLNPTPSAAVASVEEVTPDWKTYADPNGLYSFKYPSSWLSSTDVGLFNDSDKNWILGVEVFKSSLSSQDWVSAERCTRSIIGEICSINLNTPIQDWVQFTNFGSHYTSIGTAIKHHESIYEINLNARNPNQPVNDNIKNIYNLILSTFKFTD